MKNTFIFSMHKYTKNDYLFKQILNKNIIV